MSKEYSLLSNDGYRILHIHRKTGLAVLMLFFHVGSRHESKNVVGATHLLEHLFFRTGQQNIVAQQIEQLGGVTDALTGREYVVYSVQILPEHIEACVQVLGELIVRSTWSPEEFEAEKAVVQEEVIRSTDSARTLLSIQSYVHSFAGQPMGYLPMGSVDQVASLTQTVLSEYKKKYFTIENFLFTVLSPLSNDQLLKITSGVFRLPHGIVAPPVPATFAPEEKVSFIERTNIDQVLCTLALPGTSTHDEGRTASMLVETILGRGMGSRLFKELRTKHGLVYDVRVNHASYSDIGIFEVTFGCNPTHAPTVVQLIMDELNTLAHTLVTNQELARAKNYLCSGFLLSEGHSYHLAKRYSHDLFFAGEINTFDIVKKNITEVSATQVQKITKKIIAGPLNLTYIAKQPIDFTL